MTKREVIQAKINLYKQWLLLLTKGGLDEKSLGLPKGVRIQDEIDRILDNLIELRESLRNLDEN
ncbi:MAG: hypothetical protein K9J37_22370 [Saprospiraceae bacterium]|nr:hypothetical protein [Saprospiraceae bacterium]MCF8252669.1 hypothetical protein [Saprospiraceae bacterium]MCF8282868.1 hypothetical protein [Bacteroidales bacterium]MCF8314241.1 hypothetical protein [Saprospiraceae bacterium]MCF8443040.1 hypothetical protein [Saprospiraceae bacterium]